MTEILPGGRFDSKRRSRSFTWKNIILRALWALCWMLLCRWNPPQLYAWRRLVLNLWGAKVAKGARVYPSAYIWYPSNLEIGEGAVLGWNVHCYCMAKVVLEPYAEVAQFVHLVTGTHDFDSETFQLQTRPIRICSHAWLASSSFVGPGVTVGEGAVLGARGVAMKDLEPWTVYAGNPAVEIRKRSRFL
ncbi:putative colanic acid biosynthesis acetyltransferase [Stakelama marina]|uniref:Putative colanic acid biosynthesis acetyltransferase n=1 Tax=Stakelama marina TaxID=2826939 RepID=A0A8T4ICI6_9SPHN|nr:putative colanic acid biosynthesis acetyltransferase [Stakelama marina]MBR0552111.1 putative colanic acid biosynthesis acetyltransferase [Stakelama marina]